MICVTAVISEGLKKSRISSNDYAIKEDKRSN